MRAFLIAFVLLALAACNPEAKSFTLTVVKAGAGQGQITGTGISCGNDCSEVLDKDTSVTLAAAPSTGSSFGAWSGCDSATGSSCTVKMTADRTVTATFTAMPVTTIDSDITAPTTWLTGNMYKVTQAINVSARLTIQPGVLVAFEPGAMLMASAAIIADGQDASTPIIFTSTRPAPAGGDWGGIMLMGSGSSFSRCEVLYAGENDTAAIQIGDGFSASITHCTFAHHRTSLDELGAIAALDASQAAAGTVIDANLFFDNRVPLAINTTFSPGENTFDNALAAPAAPQPNKYNGIFVTGCGHVTHPTTWPGQAVPYVIGVSTSACNYVNVDTGQKLTIGSAASNAVVKFFDEGRITANGALDAHAIFTSIKDDARGGDTMGDAAATQPVAGAWGGVTLGTDGSSIANSAFYYAGADNSSPVSIRDNISATVTGTTFGHNRPETASPRAAPALDASGAGPNTVIHANVFFDNTVPLAMNTNLDLDDSNTFTGNDPGANPVGNTYQAIIVTGCGHIAGSHTWSTLKVPLLIGDPDTACNYVKVDPAGHLTIADQVVVKFFGAGWMEINGTLTASGTNGIVFTSFKDDAHGGDTNADGAASAAAPGEWQGITVSSGSTFDHAIFLYGGGAVDGANSSALSVRSNSGVTVTNSVFAHVRPSAVAITAPPALDLSDASPATTTVHGNTFFNDTVPLAINARLSLDDSNTFQVPSADANKYNAVIVSGCDHVTSTTTWNVTKVPMVIGNPVDACNYMVVDGAATLTFGPNLVMKFFHDGRLEVNAGGTLNIGSGDYLTTIKDDYLNDTLADGAGTPAPGDWLGIKYFRTGMEPRCDQASYMHYQTPDDATGCAW